MPASFRAPEDPAHSYCDTKLILTQLFLCHIASHITLVENAPRHRHRRTRTARSLSSPATAARWVAHHDAVRRLDLAARRRHCLEQPDPARRSLWRSEEHTSELQSR